MEETEARLRAELDRTIPADTDYLTKLGLINNNRQVAAEILQAQENEADPSLTHGYWDNETEQGDFLTQWPSIRSLLMELDGTPARELLLESPPFAGQIRDLVGELQESGSDEMSAMTDRQLTAVAREQFIKATTTDDLGIAPEAVFADPSVQAVILSFAGQIARAQGWTVPTTLGQAVMVWNIALGVVSHAWGPEWAQQMCSSASFQNAELPHHRNDRF